MKDSGNGENTSTMIRMLLIGLAAAGVGIGGNYALPDRGATALDERISNAKEQLGQLRTSVSELEAGMIEIWKLESKRDALSVYWVERMRRLEKLHDAPVHHNGRYRAAPGGMLFPDPP
jgi:hypothetical protein